MWMSYASRRGSVSTSHSAASVPSPSRTTPGTSAKFVNHPSPDAASRGADQPVAVRSAYLSVDRLPSVVIQLTIALSPVTDNCGARLASVPASSSGVITSGASARGAAEHAHTSSEHAIETMSILVMTHASYRYLSTDIVVRHEPPDVSRNERDHCHRVPSRLAHRVGASAEGRSGRDRDDSRGQAPRPADRQQGPRIQRRPVR